MVATISTTLTTVALPLSLCNLTSFTVVYRLTVKGVWKRLTSVTLAVFSYCYRTCSSDTDPTPTTSTGLGNLPQEQPHRQPYPKDEMDKLLQGRNCGFTTHQRKITSHTCKILCPLETIKGDPGLTSKTRPTIHAINAIHNQGNQDSSHTP